MPDILQIKTDAHIGELSLFFWITCHLSTLLAFSAINRAFRADFSLFSFFFARKFPGDTQRPPSTILLFFPFDIISSGQAKFAKKPTPSH